MAVLVLYQLAKPDSMLHGLLRRKFSPKEFWRYLLVGFLFGHILTAKANYYVILIYAFFMLLIPLAPGRESGAERPVWKILSYPAVHSTSACRRGWALTSGITAWRKAGSFWKCGDSGLSMS